MADGGPTEPPQFAKGRMKINNPLTSFSTLDDNLRHAPLTLDSSRAEWR
jgi:hypothetical protein